MSVFKKAVKSQSKLRAALFGPSGAGKTFTALEIATGIVSALPGGKIALIDSERSSASKYADRFEFDQVDLEAKDIEEYVKFIREAAAAGYSVLIIDSLTHAWQMLLDSVEKLAQAKYKGNTWSAWSEGTPEQRRLVDAIVSYPGHIIATMRSKTEWQTTTNDRGKTSPVRVGLAPEQGKGIEYEFDILFEISPDHVAHIIKDRSGKFQDKIIEKPGKEFGKRLIAWLNEGAEPPLRPYPPSAGAGQGNGGPRSGRQKIIDRIVAALLSLSPDQTSYFTDDEREFVKAKIKITTKLDDLEDIALEWEAKLESRREEYRLIPFGDDDLSALSPPKNQEAAIPERTEPLEGEDDGHGNAHEAEAAAPAAEPEEEGQAGAEAPDDDGFVDDIPWGDGEEPGAGKGKGKGKAAKSGTSDAKKASGELEIF